MAVGEFLIRWSWKRHQCSFVSGMFLNHFPHRQMTSASIPENLVEIRVTVGEWPSLGHNENQYFVLSKLQLIDTLPFLVGVTYIGVIAWDRSFRSLTHGNCWWSERSLGWSERSLSWKVWHPNAWLTAASISFSQHHDMLLPYRGKTEVRTFIFEISFHFDRSKYLMLICFAASPLCSRGCCCVTVFIAEDVAVRDTADKMLLRLPWYTRLCKNPENVQTHQKMDVF